MVGDHGIDHRAAHADRRDRSADLIIVRLLRARDEAKRAARGRQDHLARIAVGIVDELVEGHLRRGTDRKAGLVPEQKLCRRRCTRAHVFVLEDRRADPEGRRLRTHDAVDLILCRGGDADIVGGHGGRGRERQRQCRRQCQNHHRGAEAPKDSVHGNPQILPDSAEPGGAGFHALPLWPYYTEIAAAPLPQAGAAALQHAKDASAVIARSHLLAAGGKGYFSCFWTQGIWGFFDMRKSVAAFLAGFAGALLAVPAAADELSDAYAEVLANPGDSAVNLKYAAIAEREGKPRLALAAYERILLNDPGNAEAHRGMQRVLRQLLPKSTLWVASIGAGWESNPANVSSHEQSSMIELASVAMRDVRTFGSTSWQTDALGVVNIVNDDDRLSYGFLGAETGPIFDTDSWFSIHPAAGAGIAYFDNTTFYSEATGSVTLEGVKGGANQIARIKVGYRDYAGRFTTDNGWYVHVNGRWSIPHIFNGNDVVILSPWFRWSDIAGGILIALNRESDPGRYTEFGGDLAYYTPLSDRLVFGADISVSDRNYRDPGLFSGGEDRHDTTITPGATLIYKHAFWYQSDVRFQYRHRHNQSNDRVREFDDDVFTVNLDTRW